MRTASACAAAILRHFDVAPCTFCELTAQATVHLQPPPYPTIFMSPACALPLKAQRNRTESPPRFRRRRLFNGGSSALDVLRRGFDRRPYSAHYSLVKMFFITGRLR